MTSTTTNTNTTTDYSEVEANREPSVVLKEVQDHLAYMATKLHYERQPNLWKMGEWGRARTHEDYGHHFRALASLEVGVWKNHLSWTEGFWDNRKFPHEWLTDAWAIMREVLLGQLHPNISSKAISILDTIPELTSWK